LIYEIGDVRITEITKGTYLAVSCDSLGAIGEKQLDKVNVPTEWVGRFLTRVSVMELLALRVSPFLVVNTLSNEMNPTGEMVISGIKTEMSTIGLDPRGCLTGSYESNIPTSETAAGVTTLGKSERFPEIGLGFCGIGCYLLGAPKVGNEVDLYDSEIVDLPSVYALSEIKEIKDMVPVGSKGISHEVCELGKRSALVPKFQPEVSEEFLTKSGGPSTCLVFTADSTGFEKAQRVANKYQKPLIKLGTLVKKTSKL